MITEFTANYCNIFEHLILYCTKLIESTRKE